MPREDADMSRKGLGVSGGRQRARPAKGANRGPGSRRRAGEPPYPGVDGLWVFSLGGGVECRGGCHGPARISGRGTRRRDRAGGEPGSAMIQVDPPLSGVDVHRAAPDEPDGGGARLGG